MPTMPAFNKRQSFVERLESQQRGPVKHYTMDGGKILSSTGRQTHIICTLGPACHSVEEIKQLLVAGMNVARLNFSHGDYDYHGETIQNVRTACKELGVICAIMLDTKGPEIRTGGKLVTNTVLLEQDSTLILNLTNPDHVGDAKEIFVDYPRLAHVLSPGSLVKIDDGLIVCKVEEVLENKWVKVTVMNTASIGTRKGVNLPDTEVDLPSLTARDKADIQFGVDQKVDLVALSFTRTAEDVINCRALFGEAGKHIRIIVKIENRQGVDNFDAILKETDAVMVARGDLGVEIPIQEVSLKQKMMIRKCNMAGKPAVTATQMLESMVVNPRPTRAEAGDVANAVFDGTDCVMLSGETAKGDYPVESVEVMARICETAEFALNVEDTYRTIKKANLATLNAAEALAMSAVKISMDLPMVTAIIVPTQSGATAELVAKYRPGVPIIALTESDITARRCMLSRNIVPFVVESKLTDAELIKRGVAACVSNKWSQVGEMVVVVHGAQGIVSGIMNRITINPVADFL